MTENVLEIRDLQVHFPIHIGTVKAIDGVSLDLHSGEVMGLVGESGCGKSTLGFSILRLLSIPGRFAGGSIKYHGRDILQMTMAQVLDLRGKNIGMIFQDPLTSLNPLFKVGRQFIETIRTHEPKVSQKEALDRAAAMLERLGITTARLNEYPHQMSGGMRQRIMIGLALVLSPDVLIADEPTTSLDVIVGAQFLDLLKDLQRQFNLSILLISHDLGVVAQLSDRITVMYGGQVAETGTVEKVFGHPQHPYTRGLLASIPNIRLDKPFLETMPGSPPDLVNPPPGCVFQPRCPQAMEVCTRDRPRIMGANDHLAACWLYS